MRQPAIHITVVNLANLLESLGVDNAYQLSSKVLNLAHQQGLQLRNRTLIQGKAGTRKKVDRVQLKDTAVIADSFQSILINYRRQQKHKIVQQISKTDRDYTMLKTVAEIAENFCVSFGYKDRQIGYLRFCELGLRCMGKKYGLNKFKFYSERIFGLEESMQIIKADDNETGTDKLYTAWKAALLKYASLDRSILPTSTDYVHFVYARQEADLYKADYTDWVVGQFEGLAFMNVVPELSQLYSGQAASRYESYKANKKMASKAVKKDEQPEFDNEMEDYFERLEKLK